MHKLLLTMMNLALLTGEAFAQDAGAPPPSGGLLNFMPMVLIVIIMYFLIFRPQSKLRQQHEQMVQSLKRGDVVITGGGVRGTIVRVDDNNRTVSVEIAPGVEITVVKATIAEVEVRKGEPANDTGPVEKQKKK